MFLRIYQLESAVAKIPASLFLVYRCHTLIPSWTGV